MKTFWKNFDDFDSNISDNILFWPNLRNFDASLLLRRESLMILWWDLFETLINSTETFVIFVVFASLTSETLIFHCSFSDDSLMTLWRNIDDTTKVWMQSVKIIEVYNVIIISECWCSFDAWLINRWWSYEESLIRFWGFRCKP